MYELRYGGKRAKPYRLAEGKEMVAVRTHHRQEISIDRASVSTGLSEAAWQTLDQFEPVLYFQRAGVQIFKPAPDGKGGKALRDRARSILKRQKEVRFAGRVLMDPKSQSPVLYTENFFVQFEAGVAESTCKRILKEQGLAVKRALGYARNAYFAEAAEGTGLQSSPLPTSSCKTTRSCSAIPRWCERRVAVELFHNSGTSRKRRSTAQ